MGYRVVAFALRLPLNLVGYGSLGGTRSGTWSLAYFAGKTIINIFVYMNQSPDDYHTRGS